MIPIAQPLIGIEEILHVNEVLKSGMLACGDIVEIFERDFSSYIGTRFGVATSSGTTALHAALIASGISQNDKVITTPFTFAATANSILYQNAIPIFADIDPHTFNIDPKSIEKLLKKHDNVKALLIVHLFGLPCKMDEIVELAKEYNLILIEDCAQAHGAKYKNLKVGTFGDVSIFSFYPTKNMTTGEGGMIVTNNEEIFNKVQSTVNHGQQDRYLHKELGYNYRMTNISAAIGIEQLKKLDYFNNKRVFNASKYNSHICNSLLTLPHSSENDYHVYHQYTLKTNERIKLQEYLKENGIGTGIYYPIPLNEQPFYIELGYSSTDTPIASKVSKEVLSIPVHPSLSDADIESIIGVVNEYR